MDIELDGQIDGRIARYTEQLEDIHKLLPLYCDVIDMLTLAVCTL